MSKGGAILIPQNDIAIIERQFSTAKKIFAHLLNFHVPLGAFLFCNLKKTLE